MSKDRYHDLRGKLGIIKGRAEHVIKKNYRDDIEMMLIDYIDLMERYAPVEVTEGCMDMFVDIAEKLERMEFGYHRIANVAKNGIKMTYPDSAEKVDTRLTIEQVIDDVEGLYYADNVMIIPDLSDAVIDMTPSHFESLVMNLVTNAYRAVKDSSERMIAIKSFIDDGYHLTVEDTGCGIPAEDLDLIWEDGYSKSGSSGIGLATINRYGKRYNLQFRVESELGKGTRIEVIAPYG